MIITVGGSIGSGKSTLAKDLAKKYNLAFYSVGEQMRALAKAKGLSMAELSAMAETDYAIDRELDRKQREKAKGDCVIDSRLGAYMLKADFSIWLEASPEVLAKRVASRDDMSVEKAVDMVVKRRASEVKRYEDIYGINIEDQSVYDFVLNTDHLTKKQMLEQCSKALEAAGLVSA